MHLRTISRRSIPILNSVSCSPSPFARSCASAVTLASVCLESAPVADTSSAFGLRPHLVGEHLLRPRQLFGQTTDSRAQDSIAASVELNEESPLGLITDHDFYTHLLKYLLKEGYSAGSHQLLARTPQRQAQTLVETKVIHANILKIGFSLDGELGNALVDLYAKCGSLGLAEKVFKQLCKPDGHAWNSILSAHCRQGTDEFIRIFCSMRSSNTEQNQFTFAIALSACARLMVLSFGQQLHCCIVKIGHEYSSFCQGSLIDMYAKCSLMDEAGKVFDRSVDPDVVSWTTLIAGYVRIGSSERALELFFKMKTLCKTPDQVMLVTAINACVSIGKLQEARRLFSQMPNPNVVAWNVMISGHAQNGYADEALNFFTEMQIKGLKPTRSTLGSVLSAVADSASLDWGRLVHSIAIKLGLDSNIFAGSSLISMYAKCDVLDDARKVFDLSEEKNAVVWNSMLGGYAQNGFANEVLDLFTKMEECEVLPDEFTYVSALNACAYLENLYIGLQLHSSILKRNLERSIYVKNALVDMYAKSRDVRDAWRQFELIQDRDIISWNAVIFGYVHNNEEEKAVVMLSMMRLANVEPDEVSLATVLSGCANLQDIKVGEQVHCLSLKSGFESNLYVGSSIIDMYAKCDALIAANKTLNQMPEKSVVSRNALLAGLVQNNSREEALSLFWDMQVEGLEPSEFTFASILPVFDGPFGLDMGRQVHSYTLKSGLLCKDLCLVIALLRMYLKFLSKEDANKLFREMHSHNNTISWTAMISGYIENNDLGEALQIFHKMRYYGITLDDAVFASVLSACAKLASLCDGKEVHSLILKTGFSSDLRMCSALIDMYSKCGQFGDSWQVFSEESSKEDVVSWNSIIVGFAKNGFAEDALHIFSEMQKKHIQPDEITFLGVLTACSHAGLVFRGLEFFDSMRRQYGIQPRADHYACIIDLLGRGGSLEEAEIFIKNLPFEPDSVIWATLLSACRIHGDTERGKWAAEELIKLEPQNSSPYVLLSNLYAASGNWNKFNDVRRSMRNKGVRKVPGCSWIEVDRKSNLFVAGDKFHPMANDIYAMLKELMEQIHDDGYVSKLDLFSTDED